MQLPSKVVKYFSLLALLVILFFGEALADEQKIGLEEILILAVKQNSSVQARKIYMANDQISLDLANQKVGKKVSSSISTIYGKISEDDLPELYIKANGKLDITMFNDKLVSINYNVTKGGNYSNFSVELPLLNSYEKISKDIEVKKLKQAGDKDLLVMQNEIRKVRREAASHYFNILVLQKECVVIEENIKFLEKSLELLKVSQEHKNAGEIEVQDCEIKIAEANIELKDKQQELSTERKILAITIGLKEDAVLKLDEAIKQDIIFPGRDEYTQAFLANDEDLKQAELDVKSAELELERYVAGNKPEIKANAGVSSGKTWQIGIEASYSIDDGVSSELLVRKNAINASQLIFDQLKCDLTDQARKNYDIFVQKKAKLDLYQQKAERGKRYLEIVEQLQKKGTRTELDLQKAFVESRQADIDYAKAQYDYYFALFELKETFSQN